MAKRKIGKLKSFSPEMLLPEELKMGKRYGSRGNKRGGGKGNGDGNGGSGVQGDLNDDGVVNGADLTALLAGWGGDGVGDLNGDGVVDGQDLTILLANWGSSKGMKMGKKPKKPLVKKPVPDFQGVQETLTPIDSRTVNRNKANYRIGIRKRKPGRATGFSTGPGGGGGGGGGTPI